MQLNCIDRRVTPVQIAIAAASFVASLLHSAGNGYPCTILVLVSIGAAGTKRKLAKLSLMQMVAALSCIADTIS
ncbi:MAG: hypothetical protein EPN74_12780 [Rhodanobacter sp.]|nr:MAG: hypothetical protein EPN74_12780 [Rhodanobacter sp.]